MDKKKPVVVDAYMHIGIPRFGSSEHIFQVLDTYNIAQAVVVLGPSVPDLESLFEAMKRGPERVRGVGLPFGHDASERLELVRIQVDAGVIGIRMSEAECISTPGVMELLGDRGKCIYALNPVGSPKAAELFLQWLGRYPDSFIAAPHFLNPGFSWREREAMDKSCIELLRHPRFNAILSRQGGNGTTQPYPHPDYLTWVEFVIVHCGWDRIVWGSEFPVYLWRNESYSQCTTWLPALLPGISDSQLQAFWSGNAKRLLFSTPAHEFQHVAIPQWLDSQFSGIRNRTVPLIQNTTLDIPGDLYYDLLNAYLNSEDFAAERSFNDFFVKMLYKSLIH